MAKKSKFGTVGLHLGRVGGWTRVLGGLGILIPLAYSIYLDFQETADLTVGFYTLALAYFGLVSIIYVVLYKSLLDGGLLRKMNPWLTTLIFVTPAIVIAWRDLLFPAATIGIPVDLESGFLLYVGISFWVQWKINYGGCEVLSIPILFTKERTTCYAIPLALVDAIEKKIVDR